MTFRMCDPLWVAGAHCSNCGAEDGEYHRPENGQARYFEDGQSPKPCMHYIGWSARPGHCWTCGDTYKQHQARLALQKAEKERKERKERRQARWSRLRAGLTRIAKIYS